MTQHPLRFLAVAAVLAASASRTAPVYAPSSDRNFTSTREIKSLEVEPNGALRAETSGGVLRLHNGQWQKSAPAPILPKTRVQWRGQSVKYGFDGLVIGPRVVALPQSSGTHISAILPRGAILWAALFGDGIWAWNGKIWSNPNLHLPASAREITSLAQSRDGQIVWLGTRRQGVWQLSGGKWKQHLQRDEPFAHNIQALGSFRGALWAATLEDGLVMRDKNGWKHFGQGVLSSNAPRQMAVLRDKFYVRHSNEVVDGFDGKKWTKNVFPNLPRRQIISLAADEKRLYLGQWGGWSEWDGRNFTHHLKIPELQIVPLLHIFPDGNKLWLGTQNRGLLEWNAKSKQLRVHDERDGLPDDWITSLNRNGATLLAGTFNGGLAWRGDGETQWRSAPELKKLGITAIVPNGARTLVGTRYGLFRRDETGRLQAWNERLFEGEREIQALLVTKGGLWLGTRNGLLFRLESE